MATNVRQLSYVEAEDTTATKEPEWIGMSDRARLLALFDLLAISNVEVVIWQDAEPDAPDALIAWAGARELKVEMSREEPGELPYRCLTVRMAGSERRAIQVYRKSWERGAKL